MVLFAWGRNLMSQKKPSLLSALFFIIYCITKLPKLCSERREHTSFFTLLKDVPGIKEQIMSNSKKKVHGIATLVCSLPVGTIAHFMLQNDNIHYSCRKGHQMPGLMILKAFGLLYLTGFHLLASPDFLQLPERSKLIMASIMK